MSKVVVFGASGDLAKRKIMPALSKLFHKSMKIYGYARSDLGKTYPEELKKFYDYTSSECTVNFPENVIYIRGEYDDLSPLKDIIDKDTVVCLSLPPQVYPTVLTALASFEVRMIAVEKPYGLDMKSFCELEKHKNEKTRFIDHYLLKPMAVLMPELYSKNRHIFNFLDKDNIKNIECLFLEALHAEGRSYFDKSGTIKDVMQNHLVEILATILLDHSNKDVDNARLNFIRKLTIDKEKYIFGQYKSYKEEMGKDTITETFAAFKCTIDDDKWRNVPVVMAAGKGLKCKASEISFNIKKDKYSHAADLIQNEENKIAFNAMKNEIVSMSLVFNIAPENTVCLRLNKNGIIEEIILISSNEIEETLKCEMDGKGDYELLFDRSVENKYLPSVSFDEAEALWKIFDDILSAKKTLLEYESGVEMPEEALEFFKKNRE
jgi:glucose-6-phosphate 1-dehydrogenase